MGEATKEKAIRKIDAMSVNVGYPESFEDYIDDITVYSPNEKYAVFQRLMNSTTKSAYADIAESQGKACRKSRLLERRSGIHRKCRIYAN